jgi:hypothetical protein
LSERYHNLPFNVNTIFYKDGVNLLSVGKD